MSLVYTPNQSGQVILSAYQYHLAIPAFNIPYLPMLKPVVQAVVDQDSFALIEVARLEWIKFQSRSMAAVADEFSRWSNPAHVRLHLDHVPIIDEDGMRVDVLPIFEEAVRLGYQSLMVDASRLPIDENIRAVQPVIALAHSVNIPVETELGAVMGHESDPILSYEELYASGKGFTDPDEAQRFVEETGCDWLSVAVGNFHGAIAAGRKDLKKVEARLNLERLEQIRQVAGVPLVLHGGSGIKRDNVLASMQHGIAKINVATEIRQPFEVTMKETGDVSRAQQAVYERTCWVLREFLGIAGIREKVCPA